MLAGPGLLASRPPASWGLAACGQAGAARDAGRGCIFSTGIDHTSCHPRMFQPDRSPRGHPVPSGLACSLAQAVVALFLRPLLLSSFACVRGGARSSPRPRGVACRLTFSSARGRPELRVSAFGWVGWGAARGVRREAKADAPAGRRQVSRCGIDARRRPGAPALLERAVIREGRMGGARGEAPPVAPRACA